MHYYFDTEILLFSFLFSTLDVLFSRESTRGCFISQINPHEPGSMLQSARDLDRTRATLLPFLSWLPCFLFAPKTTRLVTAPYTEETTPLLMSVQKPSDHFLKLVHSGKSECRIIFYRLVLNLQITPSDGNKSNQNFASENIFS